MATETVRLYPSGPAVVESETWASLGSKKFWEEVAQSAFKEAETVTNPTTRGIKTTGVINQSFVYGTEALAKIPEGATITAASVHWWGKPSATANKLTYQKTSEGGTEIATKTTETGTTTEKWFKATVSAGDLEKLSRNSFTGNAFKSGWTNSKSGSEVRFNDNYVEVTFETTAPELPLAAAAATTLASLGLTATTSVALSAAASTTADSLALTATTRVTLSTTSSTTADALSLAATTQVALATAAGITAGTLLLNAATLLAPSTAIAATLASQSLAAQANPSLAAALASTNAAAALTAATQIALSAAADASSAAFAPTATTLLAIAASAGSSAASASLSIAPVLLLSPAAAASAAVLTTFTYAQLEALAASESAGSLTLLAPAVIPLVPGSSQSGTALTLFIVPLTPAVKLSLVLTGEAAGPLVVVQDPQALVVAVLSDASPLII